MKNPILQKMQNMNQVTTQMSLPNNPAAMLNQLSDFKRQMSGQNPRQVVENLIKSGKMSEDQFNQLFEQANSIMSILK